MKRVIVGSKIKDPVRQQLKPLVNSIYKDVIQSKLIDWPLGGNINAIKNSSYRIRFYRNKSGWFSYEEANRIKLLIEKLLAKSGNSDKAYVDLQEVYSNYITKEYGHTCYYVDIIVYASK